MCILAHGILKVGGLLGIAKKSALVMMLCCAFTVEVLAQQLNVTIFNADNGLPQSQVNCLYQDSYGFLWVGTQDGLACFDGYTFKAFTHNPVDTLSIANNFIFDIAEDNDRNIWIGTIAGVSKYSRGQGHFTNYSFAIDSFETLDCGISSISVSQNGCIWLSASGVLFLYNPKNEKFTRYPHYTGTKEILVADISPIVEDSKGTVWAGTKNGLYVLDKSTGAFSPVAPNCSVGSKSCNIQTIFEDSNRKVWVGTEDGLFVYDSPSNSYVPFLSKGKPVFSGSSVRFIGEDLDGSISVGTNRCLSRIDTNGTIRSISEVIHNGNVVRVFNVNSVIRDRSKVLWIGTLSGLVKCNYYNLRFKGFARDKGGSNLFGGNIIASLLPETDGSIWVGTWGTGLFRFNPSTGSIKHYSSHSHDANRRIDDDFVHVIFRRKNGKMLLGTRKGVLEYDSSTKTFKEFGPFDHRNLLRNNRINAIDESADGSLWIATRWGLFRIMPNGVMHTYMQDAVDSMRILSSEVRDVLVDSKGSVWVGTAKGLSRIQQSGRIAEHFTKSSFNEESLFSNDIMCLYEDCYGDIWVGTSGGIHRFNRRTKTFSSFYDDRVFANRLVYAIEGDNNGRIWLSSNCGIVMINPQNRYFRGFSINDGLVSNEFNFGASCKSDDGDLYFGSIAGFNFFNPDSINLNQQGPQVLITRIEVVEKNGRTTLFPIDSKKIRINAGFKFLNIEFSSLDFNFPEKNEYRCKIGGYDDKWIDLGTRRSVSFSNLEEQAYKFFLIGSNSDGVWTTEPLRLDIDVVAPLWRSRSALCLYIVFVLSLLGWYINRRNRTLSKINKLFKEREFALNELEEQKEELELSNKNLTDSIHYAKRIQEAIMPSVHCFKSILPDSFILYMPKDIVSGDFYWINETQNKTFVAVVDCTGHGVPGAFMSIIGIELLRNITSIEGVNDASEILNRLSVNIYETFSSGINEEGVKVKDGMDVAFCVIDREYNTLQFAGAFSNLFLLREGKIIEISGDRYSVGTTTDEGNMLFSSYYIPLQPNDMVYMLTDGYVDQFGGIEGKKFKLRRFRQLLLNIHTLPLDLQRKYLFDTINSWKGMQDQVDDILVIGIRPDLSCMF